MPKQNQLDLVTDELKSRLADAFGELRTQFKGTNPYRMEPVPRQERLAKYAEFTPEVEQQLRQEFGNPAVDNYVMKMEALKRQNYGKPMEGGNVG